MHTVDQGYNADRRLDWIVLQFYHWELTIQANQSIIHLSDIQADWSADFHYK